MKVTLNLPDWINEATEVFIVTGRGEVVAKRIKGKKWQIKTVRCQHCGECCVPSGQTEKCKWLRKEELNQEKYICSNPDRPFHCIRGNGLLDCPDKCSVRFGKP